MDKKDITQYYLFEIDNTKFHATVKYRSYRDDKGKIEHHGHANIQTLDDTFRCQIAYGHKNQLVVQQVNYESKTDFNTFFNEDHPKKLAHYLLGCLQFMVRMSPESLSIVVYESFNMDIGPQNDGYYRFYNLNNFSFAFYNKYFIEKYFNLNIERSKELIDILEEKADPHKLLSWYCVYMDMEHFEKVIDPQVKKYNTIKEFLASLSPENYKGTDFFKDSYIWLSCYIKNLPIHDYNYPRIPVEYIWKKDKIYTNIISSDKPLHDPIVDNDFYYYDKKGSMKNIVITNQMIYGDFLGTCSDIDDI
jgi:hypothetical protein